MKKFLCAVLLVGCSSGTDFAVMHEMDAGVDVDVDVVDMGGDAEVDVDVDVDVDVVDATADDDATDATDADDVDVVDAEADATDATELFNPTAIGRRCSTQEDCNDIPNGRCSGTNQCTRECSKDGEDVECGCTGADCPAACRTPASNSTASWCLKKCSTHSDCTGECRQALDQKFYCF